MDSQSDALVACTPKAPDTASVAGVITSFIIKVSLSGDFRVVKLVVSTKQCCQNTPETCLSTRKQVTPEKNTHKYFTLLKILFIELEMFHGTLI